MSSTANLGRPDGIQFRPAHQQQEGPDERSPSQITSDLLIRAAEMDRKGQPMRLRMGEPPRDYSAAYLLRQFQRDPERFGDIMARNGIALLEFNEVLDNAVSQSDNAGTFIDLTAAHTRAAFGIGTGDGNCVDFERAPTRAGSQRAAQSAGALPDALNLRQEAVARPGFWQRLADVFGEIAEAFAKLFGSGWHYDSATFDHRVDERHFAAVGEQFVASHPMELWAAMQSPELRGEMRSHLLAQKPDRATDGQWQRAVDSMMGSIDSALASSDALSGLPAGLSATALQDVMTFALAHRENTASMADLALVLRHENTEVRDRAFRNLLELPQEQAQTMMALLRGVSYAEELQTANADSLLAALQAGGLHHDDPLSAAHHYRSVGERLGAAEGQAIIDYYFNGEVDGQDELHERLLAACPDGVDQGDWPRCVAQIMAGIDAGVERQERRGMLVQTFQDGAPDVQNTIFQVLDRSGFRSALDSREANDLTGAVAYIPGGSSGAEITDDNRQARAAVLESIVGLGLSRQSLAANGQLVGHTLADTLELNRRVQENLGSSSALRTIIGSSSSEIRITHPRLGTLDRAQRQTLQSIVSEQNLRFAFSGAERTFTVTDAVSTDPEAALAEGQISLQHYFADRGYRDRVLQRLDLPAGRFESTLFHCAQSLRQDNSDAQAHMRDTIEQNQLRLFGNTSLSPAQRQGLEQTLQTNEGLTPEQRLSILTVLHGDPTLTADERGALEREVQQARASLEQVLDPINATVDLTVGTPLHELFALAAPHRADPVFFMAQSMVREFDANFGVFDVQLPGRAGTLSRQELAAILAAPEPEHAFAAFFSERGVAQPPEFRDTVVAFAHLANMQSLGELPEGVVPLAGRGATRTLRLLGQRMTDRQEGSLAEASFLRQVFRVDLNMRTDDAEHFGSDAAFLGAAGNNRQQYGLFYRAGSRTGYESTHHARDISRQLAESTPGRLANAFEGLMGMSSFDEASASFGGSHQHGVSSGSVDRMLEGVSPEHVRVITTRGRATSRDRQAFVASTRIVEEMFVEHSGVPAGNVERLTNPSPEQFMTAVRAEILRSDPPTRALVLHFAGHTDSSAFGVDGWVVSGANGSRVVISPAMLDELRSLAEANNVSLMVVADACRGGEYVDGARQRTLEQLGELPLTAPGRAELAHVQQLNQLRSALIGYHDAFLQAQALQASAKPQPFPSQHELAQLGAKALQSEAGLEALRSRTAEVLASPGMSAGAMEIMQSYLTSIEAIRQHRHSLPAQAAEGISARESRARQDAAAVLSGERPLAAGRSFGMHSIGRTLERITNDLDPRMASVLEQAARA